MADQGYELRGRVSKVISDGLRWEIRNGRVVRLGRGRHAYRGAPKSTVRRVRAFARQSTAWIVAPWEAMNWIWTL